MKGDSVTGDLHAEGASAPSMSRRSVLTGAAAAASLVAPAAITLATAAPTPAKALEGATRRVTLYAEALPNGLYGYGLAPGQATVPGPILEIWEGDTLEITLVNNTTQRLSIHPHGVDYSVDSDGSPLNASFNMPGETRTYTWRTRTAAPTDTRRWLPGSAGYWHYHDHAMGTDHGTGGVAKGLYGALIVRRRGDILPAKQFTVVFNDMMINNLMAPNTPMFEANLGQRVEWLVIGHGATFHTFHLHAHRWADNRTGYLTGPDDPTAVIDIKDLNPGSSFGFQVLAGDGVGPGVWMYHCHVQFHADGGMVGLFLVRNSDGSLPPGAQEAIDRFHGHTHTMQN
jgi:FtsP/CotA-like multicopper oxidase with cupredoxin domain